MKILEKYESQIHEGLHSWADEHTASHERLVLLDIDPDTYTDQRILSHTIVGEPIDPILIDTIAAGVDPRYPKISEVIEDCNPKALRVASAILRSGQNLEIGTDHDELVDIALIMARLTARFRQEGVVFDSSLTANKMAAYLGVIMDDGEVMPATQLLGMCFDATYLTIPNNSSSKERLGISSRVIATYNNQVIKRGIEKRQIATRKTGKPMMKGSAFTGTVNKPLDTEALTEEQRSEFEDQDVIVIGRANTGILKFTKDSLTMLACSRMKDDITVEMSAEPRCIQTKEELDDAMEHITAMQNELDPAHRYVYDHDGSLPVIRPSEKAV